MKVVYSKLVISTSTRRAEEGAKNLHSPLKLLVFCSLRAMEVLGLCRHILHDVHRGKLLNLGDGGLIEGQTIAGL
jgi:hypothetical protein